LRLLLDEMYPPALADALRDDGLDATTVAEMGMAGRPDPDVLAASTASDRVLLAENVADFARICAERLSAGNHHPGVLIALSSRFSRRPAGIPRLAKAVQAATGLRLEDRVVYLAAPTRHER
jgi:hypothetical protein